MRSLVFIFGLSAAFALAPLGSSADADHQASVCGRLLEYVHAPSDNLGHGYAHIRLTTASGDTSVLFHHINPSNMPSRIEPGATQPGANICISGPYVHIVGSSPYVSPYDLRLAGVKSLPSTSTAPAQGLAIQVLAFLSVATLVGLRLRSMRFVR